jgi:hypothetical protein
MSDRLLRGLIEDAWSKETRSPSQIMQELTARFRDAGLHIFRHRRGMLFVSSVRIRPFAHEQAGTSAQVQSILQTVSANPGMNRKDLAEKVLAGVAAEDGEARKLALASDLRWLISEGNVIEFNDGSLDLPRVKVKPVETAAEKPAETPVNSTESGPTETLVAAQPGVEPPPDSKEAEPEASEPEKALPSEGS